MADTGNKIYIAKESTLETIITKLDTLSTKDDVSGISEVATKSDLDTLANTVSSSVGAVKSVQRGVKHFSKNSNYTDITISSVTTSKATINVLSNGNNTMYHGSGNMSISTVDNLGISNDNQILIDAVLVNSTTLRVFHSWNNSIIHFLCWEVIEFK